MLNTRPVDRTGDRCSICMCVHVEGVRGGVSVEGRKPRSCVRELTILLWTALACGLSVIAAGEKATVSTMYM